MAKLIRKIVSLVTAASILCALLPCVSFSADDVSVEDGNLISNGSFSSGDTTGWTNRLGTDITGAVVEYDDELGCNAMIIQAEGGASTQSIGTVWNVKTGSTYKFSFYVGGKKPVSDNYTFNRVTDACSNDGSYTCAGSDLVAYGADMADGKWTHFEVTFVAKTDTVYFQSSWASGKMKFAGFKLYDMGPYDEVAYYYGDTSNVFAKTAVGGEYEAYTIFNDANGEKYYLPDTKISTVSDGVAYIGLEKLGGSFTVRGGMIYSGNLDDGGLYPGSENFAAFNWGEEGTYDRLGIALLTVDPSYPEYWLAGEYCRLYGTGVHTTLWAIGYDDYLALDLSSPDGLYALLTNDNIVADGVDMDRYVQLDADVLAQYVDDKNRVVIVGSSCNGIYGLGGSLEITDGYYVGGSCGDNLTWNLHVDGTLTVKGSGEMTESPWSAYRSQIKTVVIEDGVTSIVNNAFYNCSNLSHVSIPSSVKNIDYYAFRYCNALTEVKIPEGVETMQYSVFEDCGGLVSVSLPESLSYLGLYSFKNCSKLTTVNIPSGITEIGREAFYNCTSLTSVTLSEGLEVIDIYAFYNCTSLASVTLPDGLTSIGSRAFYNCTSLASVTLPDGLTSIGEFAFYSCTSLASVTLPSGLTSIGSHAFYSCTSLASVTLPSGLTSISNDVFRNCTSLTGITIPEGVTSIGSSAFYDCSKLSDISIPSSVKTIDFYAFRYCTALTEVKIPEGVETMNYSVFEDCSGLVSVSLPESLSYLGPYNFKNCSKLTTVNIPSGITGISNELFRNCTSLASIEIPDGVTSIGEYAFCGDTALEGITLPKAIEALGRNAFNGCVKITEIEIPKSLSAATYGAGAAGSISEGVFAGSGLKNVSFEDGITTIPGDLFAGCAALESIIVPDTVTQILTGAFQFCTSLKNVTLPESVAFMDNYVFRRCDSLTSVKLPEGIKSLGNYAFAECSSLKELKIPSGVTSIGQYTFYKCTSLASIDIPNAVTQLGKYAFSGCTSLSEIKIPRNISNIDEYTFGNCTGLKNVVISEGTESIGYRAFYNCTGLEAVTLPDSVTDIDTYAFANCSNFTLHVMPDSYAETYAVEKGINFEYTLAVGSKITLLVTDESGKEITEGISVQWYDPDSNDPIASGKALSNAEEGREYTYKITLSDALAFEYSEPPSAQVTAENGAKAVTVVLKALKKTVVTGKITDEIKNNISGAKIRVEQKVNGTHSYSAETISEEDGSFTIELYRTAAKFVVEADGYYNAEQLTVLSFDKAILDEITLKKLPDTKITLTVNKREAAIDGEAASETVLTSFSGIEFELFNVTKNSALTKFSVQYPSISFDPMLVDRGDIIRVTASSLSDEMFAEPIEVVIDDDKTANGKITFSERGKLAVGNISGASSATAMVFNSSGRLEKSYNVSAGFETDSLKSGSYTLVLIKNTNLLRNVSAISKLDEIGLTKGTDYYAADFELTDSVVTYIDAVNVPELDMEKLYYTVSEKTFYSANKSKIIAGNLVKMQLNYEIDDKYNSAGETLTFELPDNVYFIENSLVLNGKPGIYAADENKVTVNVNARKASVLFYVSGAEAGDYVLNSYLSFEEGGQKITQPVGSAGFSVENFTVNIIQDTAFLKAIPISGIAQAKSNITVYVDDEAVSTTTSNALGNWYSKVDLPDSYNLEIHTIRVEAVNAYGVKAVSDDYVITYNESYAHVSKVTMYNTAHKSGDLTPVEYVTVFDFLDPSPVAQVYNMWPGVFTTFTFTIEFTGEVEDVVLYIHSLNGNIYGYNAVYDPDTGLWIVTAEISDFNDSPVNVSVDYNVVDMEFVMSREGLNDIMTVQNEPSDDELDAIVGELDELYDIMNSEGLDDETFQKTLDQIIAKLDELSASMGYEGAEDETEDELLQSMTDEELLEYIENENAAGERFLDLISADIAEVEAWMQELQVDIKITSCDGISEEALLEDGFNCVDIDDGSKIYTKYSDGQIFYADFGSDKYAVITPDRNSEYMAQLLAIMDELEQVSLMSSDDDIISLQNTLSNILSKVPDILTNLEDVEKVIKGKLQQYVDGLVKTRQKLISTMGVMAKRLKKLGIDKANNQVYQEIGAIAHKMWDKIKFLNNLIDDLDQKMVHIGELFKRVTGTILIFISVLDYVVNLISLWKSLPGECPCSDELLASIKAQILALGFEVISFVTAQVALLFTDFVSAIPVGLTAGATLAITFGIIATQVAIAEIVDKHIKSRIVDLKKEIRKLCRCGGGDDCKCGHSEGCFCGGGICECGGVLCQCMYNCQCTADGGVCMCMENCTCNCSGPIPGGGGGRVQSGGAGGLGQNDPSGYVCEAVPSNRIEGVTATAYYLDDELDEFGEPTGNKTEYLWEAGDYNQINPLVTDAGGSYAWDVPMGKWIVRFSKDGYYDTDSSSVPGADDDGYLPVPPPQMEVHVAMVSKSAPTVKSVNAYNDAVRIEFSQYMDIDSVNTDNVTVTSGGAEVSGYIEPLNAEASFEDESVEYASIFMFVPDSELSGKANISVKNVKNYASKEIASVYNTTSDVYVNPESLSVAEKMAVDYSGGAIVTVRVLPEGAGANKTINVKTSSPSIVGIGEETIVTDEDGNASLMVRGNLPGTAVVTFSLDGTDLTAKTEVTVGAVQHKDKCAKVTASIESGSAVDAGTRVELSTATDGAKIYYSLDGLEYIEYTQAIEITKKTNIVAYAAKDGVEDSAAAGFVYYLSGKRTVSVNVANVQSGSTVILAAYGEDGIMTDCEALTADEIAGEKVDFRCSVDAAYIKVMQWASLEALLPLCETRVEIPAE